MRGKFSARVVTHLKAGYSTRQIFMKYLTPEAQRLYLNRAIVGYDPHHEDAPGDPSLKFLSPRAKAAIEAKPNAS